MLLGITDGLFVESHRMYAAERPFSAPRAMQPDQMTTGERAALERLLAHGSSVTDQSQRVADFLLAWWNAWLTRLLRHHNRVGRRRGDRRRYVHCVEAVVHVCRPELIPLIVAGTQHVTFAPSLHGFIVVAVSLNSAGQQCGHLMSGLISQRQIVRVAAMVSSIESLSVIRSQRNVEPEAFRQIRV